MISNPDNSVTFTEEEVKNLAAFVHGGEELLAEINDHLQEIFDQMSDEEEEGD